MIPRWLTGLWLVGLLLAACGAAQPGNTAVSDATIIFQDAFAPGATGPWLLEGDEVGRTAVVNGELVIAVDQPNTVQYTMLEEPTFTDFSLEVEARQLAGHPESSFGILARMQNGEQFYRFSITGNGLYMVERRNADGRWTQHLPDWTAAEAINQGLNATNHLRLEARGATLSFYVNGVLLHQLGDALFPTGNIALVAGTFGQPGLQAAFDNLIVREVE